MSRAPAPAMPWGTQPPPHAAVVIPQRMVRLDEEPLVVIEHVAGHDGDDGEYRVLRADHFSSSAVGRPGGFYAQISSAVRRFKTSHSRRRSYVAIAIQNMQLQERAESIVDEPASPGCGCGDGDPGARRSERRCPPVHGTRSPTTRATRS